MSISATWDGARYVCTPVAEEPVPEPTPEPEPDPRRAIAYSQRDERWARVPLGRSSYTMYGAGCAVTDVAIIGTLADPSFTPLDMVTWLNANGGFTSGGLLYWAKAAEAVPGLDFVDYYVWRQVPADIAKLKEALAHNPQVIQVDFKPSTAALDTHFVVALGMTEDETDVNIIDPWTAGRGTLLGLYAAAGWDLRRAVYAMAEFRLARG